MELLIVWLIMAIVILAATIWITRRVFRIDEIVEELNIANAYLKKMVEVATKQDDKIEQMRREREDRINTM